jgi:hypothetical protein
MGSFKKCMVFVFLAIMVIVTVSWGFLVHKTVHQLAVYELPKEISPFFYQNMEYLVTNAPRPDMRRSQDSTEATKHFIDLEIGNKNVYQRQFTEIWVCAVSCYLHEGKTDRSI